MGRLEEIKNKLAGGYWLHVPEAESSIRYLVEWVEELIRIIEENEPPEDVYE